MIAYSRELELPLGAADSGDLALRRIHHLAELPGVDDAVLARLARAYPSLAAVYAASESELARVAGAVAAAQIRWFLDAPLATGALRSA